MRSEPYGIPTGSAKNLLENHTVAEQTQKTHGIYQDAPPLPDKLQTPYEDSNLKSRRR